MPTYSLLLLNGDVRFSVPLALLTHPVKGGGHLRIVAAVGWRQELSFPLGPTDNKEGWEAECQRGLPPTNALRLTDARLEETQLLAGSHRYQFNGGWGVQCD